MTKFEEIARAIGEGDRLHIAWIESATIKSGFHVCRDDGAPDSYRPVAGPFATTDAADREAVLRRVRLVVEAMREPSEAMIEAGVVHRFTTTISGENNWPTDTAAMWHKMLDAILAEAPETQKAAGTPNKDSPTAG